MKKVRIVDYVLLVWCLFMFALSINYLNTIDNLQETDLLYLYHSNQGIQIFAHIDLFLYGIAGCTLLFSVWKKEITRNHIIVLATSLILLVMQCWLHMWYSSTFYYGDIRGMQGWLPLVELLYVYYLIWLLPLKRTKYNAIRWGLCIGATLLFIGLFELVLEPWKLNWL